VGGGGGAIFDMLVEKFGKDVVEVAVVPVVVFDASGEGVGIPRAALTPGSFNVAVCMQENVFDVIQYINTEHGMAIVNGTIPTAIALMTFFIVFACPGFCCCCPASPPSSIVIKNDNEARSGRPYVGSATVKSSNHNVPPLTSDG
jgi:hypothetical protein